MSVAVMTDAQWRGLTRALAKPEWLRDGRFATPEDRDMHIDDRLNLTQEVLRTRDTAYWQARLEAEGVPCAPVATRNDLVDHPQVVASGSLVEFEHPVAGTLRQARHAARFDGTPAGIRRGAPQLGEHTDEVLADIGYGAREIGALREAGIVGG